MSRDRLVTLPRLAAVCFGFQAAAVAGWWLVSWRWPAARAAFQPAGHPEEALSCSVYLARPLEEADLERRFGDDYRRYRAAVRCWWPRRRAYRPGE